MQGPLLKYSVLPSGHPCHDFYLYFLSNFSKERIDNLFHIIIQQKLNMLMKTIQYLSSPKPLNSLFKAMDGLNTIVSSRELSSDHKDWYLNHESIYSRAFDIISSPLVASSKAVSTALTSALGLGQKVIPFETYDFDLDSIKELTLFDGSPILDCKVIDNMEVNPHEKSLVTDFILSREELGDIIDLNNLCFGPTSYFNNILSLSKGKRVRKREKVRN